MKSQMSKSEMDLRKRFDFSKAVRGKFHERYKKGIRVHFLSEEPSGDDDPLGSSADSSTDISTRDMGKRFFESQLKAAGLSWEEPERPQNFDYVVYPPNGNGKNALPYFVQLKTSANETFSLHKTDVHSPHSLIAYVWRVQSPEDSTVYALTYDDAFRIIQAKGYVNTPSWGRGGYSVTHAGSELKQMLAPFRMTPERWEQRLQDI